MPIRVLPPLVDAIITNGATLGFVKILDNPDLFSNDTVGQTNFTEVTSVAEKVMGTSYSENNIPFQQTTLHSQFLAENLQKYDVKFSHQF